MIDDKISSYYEFDYNYYQEIINEIKKNYSIINTVKNKNIIKKYCLLRHDIDVCPKIALNFAKFENTIGVNSLYMFLADSNFYKLEDNILEILEIMNMGHEIGIHFDCSKTSKENINKDIEDVKFKFSKLFNIKVNSISFHRPSQELIGGKKLINDLYNCYSKELVKYYISDSRYRWRVGDPIKYIKKGYPNLQLLTHPIWWSEKEKNPINNFLTYFNDRTKSFSYAEKENLKNLILEDFPSLKKIIY